MQLARAPGAAPGGGADPARVVSPFTRTLLALTVIAVPALGGVLPEDRADVLWHDYSGGGITVKGPSVLVRKKASDSLSLSAGYYEDMISSASIDVKLSASPYRETRRQENVGFDYLHGKSTYSAGYIHSKEPDYTANTSFYSVSQDMFGDLTTLTLGYRRGWDQIFRDIKTPGGVIENDPTFKQRADHRGYSLSLSQILTRNAILNFNYELLTDQGYLANPYRQVRYLSAGGVGFTLAPQVYPNTRTSNAASLELKYFLPWHAAVTGKYRFFRDTWGIVAHTAELGYTHPWKQWVLDGTLRFYQQRQADFYSDLFPRANYQNFMARDRELAAFRTYTIGVGASYQFAMPGSLSWLNKNTFNVRVDHLLVDYSDFRNALLAAQYGAGNEPLYKLNANIFQLFVSVWF